MKKKAGKASGSRKRTAVKDLKARKSRDVKGGAREKGGVHLSEIQVSKLTDSASMP